MKYFCLFACFFLLPLAACNKQSKAGAAMLEPAHKSDPAPAAPSSEPIGPLPPPPKVAEKMGGLTFVAPPEPFPENPMPSVKAAGASWISVIPYAYTRMGVPRVRHEESHWQWWGERPDGVRETIRLAREAGLKVMLKPQVYINGGWTGTMDFNTETDWGAWEADYERYILRYARLADSMKVDLFCIGTEFHNAIDKRPHYWKGLIAKIRSAYKGRLTYSSNWDDWDKFPFWDQLDYIGLGGYFPLVDAHTPPVDSLRAAWKPIVERLRNFSARHGKPVLFSEFGYLSVDGCGWRNWELERGIERRPINEQAQANCFEALFSTFFAEDWWAGGFLWKWFPNMRGHEGYPERDYTPQGKIGAQVIKKWYEKTQ